MENSVKNANQFFSLKDAKGNSTVYTKSRNIEIMMCKETDDIIKELCESFL